MGHRTARCAVVNVPRGTTYALTTGVHGCMGSYMAKARAKEYPPEVVAEAKRRYEAGSPAFIVSRAMGLPESTIKGWARKFEWANPADQAITGACNTIEGALAVCQSLTEADYDQRLRRLALGIPSIIGQLSPLDLVGKADKVCRLIEVSREILGKVDKSRGNPVISVGILSAGGLPRRVQRVDLIDNEPVVSDACE